MSDDLIRLSDAIKAVSEPFDRKYWQCTTRSIRDTVKALKELPSFEPKFEITADQLAQLLREGWTISAEPNQGEWMEDENGLYCSECKERAFREYSEAMNNQSWYEDVPTKFCPNCGAKMKGAEDETDS